MLELMTTIFVVQKLTTEGLLVNPQLVQLCGVLSFKGVRNCPFHFAAGGKYGSLSAIFGSA